MRTIILSGLIIFLMFSADLAWAQNLPSNTSLTVAVLQSYSYRADDGTTVVLGEVQNNNFFPVTNVKVGVLFLDQNDNTIEYKTGTTLLQVVPPEGKAQFSISSTNANPLITKVSVNMAGFVSSSTRDQVLKISPGVLQISDKTLLSGTMTNNGNQTSANTRLYLISYDAFQRVVAIGTATVPSIGTSNTVNFTITSISSSRAKSYAVVAESDQYQSAPTDVTNVLTSLPVVISNTMVTDQNGTEFSTIPVGVPVKISSDLKYMVSSSAQPYVYYVQVKQFGGQVEFIGQQQGVFLSGEENPSVTWTPDTAGSYYIETYVWDSNTVPLSSAGTRINVVLVKS